MYKQYNIQKKKLNKKAILLIIGLILVMFLLISASKSPKISLNGDSTVTLNLNSSYSDQGATAKYGSKNISSNIELDTNGYDPNRVRII